VKFQRAKRTFPAAILAVGVLAGCSSSSSPNSSQLALSKAGGDAQNGTVGQALGTNLQVVVKLDGTPQAGRPVDWSTTSGSMAPTSNVTDANGNASSTWTLGTTAGAVTAKATVSGATGSPLTFNATAEADAADLIAAVAGNNQNGDVGTDLTTPLQVKVTDQFGNPVAGVAVAWEVQTLGAATVAPLNSNTNASGVASTTVTLGNTAQAFEVNATATVPNGSPVVFDETADPLPTAVTVEVALSGALSFTPKVDTVAVGGTVTWHWNGGPHSVTQDPGSPAFTDHNVTQSAGFVFGPITFNSANSYFYHCSVHGVAGNGTAIGTAMAGAIVVR
jgi:adhesin/invasin